jgi:CDP-6-deoxy-D-xylo-4-hexulose-3-dehydrase
MALFNPGEIVLLDFPLKNQQGSKYRPGLILAEADHSGDHLVAYITSHADLSLTYPHCVSLGNADLSFGSMAAESAVRVDKVITVGSKAIGKGPVARLKQKKLAEVLKKWNGLSTRTFSRVFHSANRPGTDPAAASFVAGKSSVPYAGRVFTEDEVVAGAEAMLDFWLTLGKEGDAFEAGLAKFLGVKRSILCNSGSSANLLAISALTSAKLGDRRLKQGDEVITVAAGFPTTVAPILQNGLVPVFIDNDTVTCNARVEQLEEAFREGKTKAVMMAHTLGNPFNLSAIQSFCKRHGLWLIEDNCDALGCQYDGRPTGSFGDLSTQSFYPPHHLTLGEGGAVNIVGNMLLKTLVESFRDWGRDCWCASGVDNTCGKRFGWQLGELPPGYDHKFIYSHLGYNLKPLDVQAAIGRKQLERLPAFVEARKKNWHTLRSGLADLAGVFDFMLPTHAVSWSAAGFEWDGSGHITDCSWFGFMLRVKPDAPFKKFEFARFLDEKKIGNRMLFGGNLLRQPVFVNLRKESPTAFRIRGLTVERNAGLDSAAIHQLLPGADEILEQAIFIGVYPGLSPAQIDYVIDCVHKFVGRYGDV